MLNSVNVLSWSFSFPYPYYTFGVFLGDKVFKVFLLNFSFCDECCFFLNMILSKNSLYLVLYVVELKNFFSMS